MPSFFESIKRIAQGKPVFDENDVADGRQDRSQPVSTAASSLPLAPDASIVKNQESTFPVVHVEDVDSRGNGDRLQVYGVIQNEWNHEVFVDKIRWLNITRELDFTLRAGEQRQVLIYDGPELSLQLGSEGFLEYKTHQGGDYFQAVHEIRYEFTSERTYEISELRLRRPIRDIHG